MEGAGVMQVFNSNWGYFWIMSTKMKALGVYESFGQR